jgi:DNA-binding response OmpR family regulator
MLPLFLVEDDPLMSRMYERAFKASGFDVRMAYDGEEAINTLKNIDQAPGMAVLDIMMPKKSGFDVLRFMKSDSKLKDIPVVLLTNLSGADEAKKGLDLGAVEYLVKSNFTPREIVDKIKEVSEKYSTKTKHK